MTLEFQDNLLKYLFQNPEAKKYAKDLDESIFDAPMADIIFKLWKDYVKTYKAVPSKGNFIEFFDREWEGTNSQLATPELKKKALDLIARVYSPLNGDTVFIREMIVDYAQKKLTKRLFTKNAEKINTGSDKFFQNLAKEMAKIVRLREDTSEKEANRGHFYIGEPDVAINQKIKAIPTRFHALNMMTSAGGFYAPQLIVFMKSAKAFGTGFMLDMVAFSLRQGRKVFYADTENGLKDIYTRLDMALLECEEKDLPKHRSTLKRIKAEIAKRGGEFKACYFPGGTCTMDDLDAELTQLYEQTGFKPDEIYNDYIDKFVPSDKSIKENRFKIRNVYEAQMRINVKWNVPCFTISPISGDEGRPFYTVRDFGEDKYKAYNCHAAFAICCTEAEFKNGTMRVIPVVQRKGTAFQNNADTTLALKVDRQCPKIEEIDSEIYLSLMELEPPATGRKGHRTIDLKNLKDE